MYAWEKPFEAVVRAARASEMGSLRKSMFVRSMFLGFMIYTERSIIFITALTMVLTGTMVTANTVCLYLIYYLNLSVKSISIQREVYASSRARHVSFWSCGSFMHYLKYYTKTQPHKLKQIVKTILFVDILSIVNLINLKIFSLDYESKKQLIMIQNEQQ